MEGFEKPKMNPTDGTEGNYQQEAKGAERSVATMFEGIGVEALGRIRENPKFENRSERSF
jgi:hypothetical protein